MTLADLRKLAKTKGYRRPVVRPLGSGLRGWIVVVHTDRGTLAIDAFHPLRAVAIRMVALGLRALPRKP